MVLEKHKDGKPFYFTIDSLMLDPILTLVCNTAGYFAKIKSYSDSACKVPADN